jgi:tRNA(fMet)-specific endonuclease VapC
LPLDAIIVQIFTIQKLKLERSGVRLEDFDLFIAATALAHDLTLVTNNIKHFERIPKLKIYS